MVPEHHTSNKQDLILEKHIKMQIRRQGGYLHLKHASSQSKFMEVAFPGEYKLTHLKDMVSKAYKQF